MQDNLAVFYMSSKVCREKVNFLSKKQAHKGAYEKGDEELGSVHCYILAVFPA